jgi:uncharacterized protein YjlB
LDAHPDLFELKHGRECGRERTDGEVARVPALETVKKLAERITGWSQPTPGEAQGLIRTRKAHLFHFRDDGFVPNHPRWPLTIYRGAVQLPEAFDPASVFEQLFARHGWRRSWRNGVYDFVHYHSRIHEALGVARGHGTVRFGGSRGRKLELKAGDVAILPAGTGHQCLASSDDFLVVGAYPSTGAYDLCRRPEDRDKALATIPKVARPRTDPVFGSRGSLLTAWKTQR